MFILKPSKLVPFNVRQQQVPGNNDVPGAVDAFSSVGYVEVNVYGSQLRLLQGGKLTIDGIRTGLPFVGLNGISVNRIAGKLVLATSFGLTVYWDGSNKATYSIGQNYSKYICGLCGNADGLF